MNSRRPIETVFILALFLATGGVWSSCHSGGGGQAQPGVNPTGPAPQATAEQRPVVLHGPRIQVIYSSMADGLFLLEGLSLWRKDLSRVQYQAYEKKFGVEESLKHLFQRFALIRSELEDKTQKAQLETSFDAPFGPEGFFPSLHLNLVERLWSAALETSEPAALRRSLAGIVEPADAETIADLLGKIIPRLVTLRGMQTGEASPIEPLLKLLSAGKLEKRLIALGTFCGVDTSTLTFTLRPVWLPVDATGDAFSIGDAIFLPTPAGSAIGPGEIAKVTKEMARHILAHLNPETKSLLSLRLLEMIGFRDLGRGPLETVLDAFGYGVCAPLAAQVPAQVPAWPGDDQHKRLVEAVSDLLRGSLDKPLGLDVEFANRLGEAFQRVAPARPRDFLHGAMVVSEETLLIPFKSQVVRWTVWKFPPSQKFDYPKKLDRNPGRSVLILATPGDLAGLATRFPGQNEVLTAIQKAAKHHARWNKAVFIAQPRPNRGYVFLLCAAHAEDMRKLTKAFFALDKVPSEPVEAP